MEKEKEKGDVSLIIPKLPRICDKGMVINPPVYLEKDTGRTRRIIGGDPYAEIFVVRVIAGGKKYSKIHGDIRVICGAGNLYLFNRPRLNPQIVPRNGELELVGPTYAIPASGNFDIELHLKNGCNRVIYAVLDWCFFQDAKNLVYSDVFYGRKGSILISYAVYSHALAAPIKITFKPSRFLHGISGTITAFNNKFPNWRSVLFRKKRGDHLLSVFEHEEEVELPLLRSVTAVPVNGACKQFKESNTCTRQCEKEEENPKKKKKPFPFGFVDPTISKRPIDGCLFVDVNLMNGHDGDTIAKGVLKFPVEKYGGYMSTILSEYGELRVKVSFVDMFNHIPFGRKG